MAHVVAWTPSTRPHGASPAKTALAEWSKVPLAEIEEVWHGLRPPYTELFAWLSGAGPRPHVGTTATFRPLMLSHQIEDKELAAIAPSDFVAEWKWDGIRVQAAHQGGEKGLFSRTGDDISGAFPDVVEALPDGVVLDGELLVMRGSEVAPFNDLQQRLNRKAVTQAMLKSHPAHIRLYDMLFHGEEDLRVGGCQRDDALCRTLKAQFASQAIGAEQERAAWTNGDAGWRESRIAKLRLRRMLHEGRD